ncbi:unnamed protein product [Acanthoscelides obtectus]|uniref:Uncharacterized protein n=1 Tax=Acanthoscelides obtectus TaxID=200917 RepID=A0A9P0K9P9_ACAOB|nr:unnamed protein product [Acanthoscelides obtectus]CAK1673479.1 hypothetical protein AOBTE_LOCUS29354 [Acanthoscelides obtectus]
MFKVQKSAIRCIASLKQHESCRPCFRSLNIITLYGLIIYEKYVLARTNSEEIKLYNALPDEVRSLQLSRFKCKLKSVLTRACIYSFEEYYALARDRQAFLTKLNG